MASLLIAEQDRGGFPPFGECPAGVVSWDEERRAATGCDPVDGTEVMYDT